MIVKLKGKPRKSKTSEVYSSGGLDFFLYNTKTGTKGNAEIYLYSEPYPLIKVVESNEKAKLWIDSNISQIMVKLSNMDNCEFITREEFIKPKREEVVESDCDDIKQMQYLHNKYVLSSN